MQKNNLFGFNIFSTFANYLKMKNNLTKFMIVQKVYRGLNIIAIFTIWWQSDKDLLLQLELELPPLLQNIMYSNLILTESSWIVRWQQAPLGFYAILVLDVLLSCIVKTV